MAPTSVALRLKPKTQTLRLFSSSSPPVLEKPDSSSSPPATPDKPNFSTNDPFTDIKSRLRQPSAEPRRIPLHPPKPDVLSPPQSDPNGDEIRKHLAEFRLRSSPPSSSTSFKSISFQELFKTTAVNNSDKPRDHISFDAVRQSLRLLGDQKPNDPSPLSSEFQQQQMDERPNRRVETLRQTIFRKEMRDKEEGRERKTEFLKPYSYEELGEKLRMLRPEGDAGKVVPFSLGELNERLVRLREMEDDAVSTFGGLQYRQLRESLLRLRDADAAKKATAMTRINIFPLIGGRTTPEYMLRPPKEHLVEKYFHPDLMSSAEKLKLELKRVRDEFKLSESDCGSTPVQVAQLTTKIKHLSSVLHKKDKHSQKGLQAMVQRRKRLLKYLRRRDWDSYCLVLRKLGLRDAPEYRT